jgi:hypothetical protein
MLIWYLFFCSRLVVTIMLCFSQGYQETLPIAFLGERGELCAGIRPVGFLDADCVGLSGPFVYGAEQLVMDV